MKKILLINSSLNRGGSERVMSILANELSKREYIVSMAIVYPEENVYKLEDSINTISLNYKNKINILKKFEQVYRLKNIIKSDNYDVIISFMQSINILTLLASINYKGKLIISERNDPSKIKNIVLNTLANILYPKADILVVQTDSVINYFNKKIQKQCIVIPNPINPNLPKPYRGNRDKRIVAVGRLNYQKNFSLLLRAFKKFLKRYDDYILEIYGEGILLESLKEECKSLNIIEKVVFKGYVSNVNNEILKAKMYVSSSDYEGISNAMLEALGMGIPTICTDCPVGGARLIIKNKYNGLLVPVGDVDKLAKSMIELVENDKLVKKISLNSVNVNNDYSVEKIIDKWEKIIK